MNHNGKTRDYSLVGGPLDIGYSREMTILQQRMMIAPHANLGNATGTDNPEFADHWQVCEKSLLKSNQAINF